MEANQHSWGAAISADGRYVAFELYASNLVDGDTNGWWDVFVRDRVAGVTERVSVGPGGAQANWPSRLPAISADGRYVAFISGASNLAPPEDTSILDDVGGADRASGGQHPGPGAGPPCGRGNTLPD
jgi:Tol biopolymer transport system component